MDIDRQRTLADRISANMLDKNRDGRLSADERISAITEYIGTFAMKAASLSPPDRTEFRAFETATADSVLTDFAKFARVNNHLFPNGIQPITRKDAEQIAVAERQLAAAVRQWPEPDPLTKLKESGALWVMATQEKLEVEIHSVMDDITTPRAPKADTGPQVPLPTGTGRTP
jgi:hypothetical protein